MGARGLRERRPDGAAFEARRRETRPDEHTARDILRSRPSRLEGTYVFPSTTGETPLDACNFVRRIFLPALRTAGVEGFSAGTTFGTRSRAAW